MTTQPCKICSTDSKYYGHSIEKDCEAVECSYCGKYYLMHSFEPDTYSDLSNFYKVSSWIREQNDLFQNEPEIDEDKFKEILNMRDKRIKEKFDLMMIYLSNLVEYEELTNDIFIKCWMKNAIEFDNILSKALDLKYVEAEYSGIEADSNFRYFKNLTFDGLEYIENLDNPNIASKNIFVAFNFEDNLKEVFNVHLNQAITENGFNYLVVNQDSVEHNKSINDEIIVKLKSSRVVIADFTNNRNSVYFEAGFAMGMNIPIIWTCQEGHEGNMSFDTRQFPHIIWQNRDDLVKQVINRIKVIL